MERALQHGSDYPQARDEWAELLTQIESNLHVLSPEERAQYDYQKGRFLYGSEYEKALTHFARVLVPNDNPWQAKLTSIVDAPSTPLEALALYWALNALINVPNLDKGPWMDDHHRLYALGLVAFTNLEMDEEKGNLIYDHVQFGNSDLDSVLEKLKEVAALSPKRAPQILNRCSMIEDRRDHIQQAFELVEQAIAVAPEDYDTYLLANFRNRYVGLGIKLKKPYDQLKPVMEKVLEEAERCSFDHSYHAWYYFHAAQLEDYAGNSKQALEFALKGANLTKDEKDRQEIQDWIQKHI
ncbi:MAG: hypothetical protein KDK78_06000 [Chlamydiia bacterium]|nr:hypothetical protein [Chlamydiia bacterium]